MNNMTHDQKAIHFETWQHIHEVRKLLHHMQMLLGERALDHDQSKMTSAEECAVFAKLTPRLGLIEYGSEEYASCLDEMGPALRHHYENNSHHPEAHAHGVRDMNLLDVLEMLCDWKASTLRTKNGDLCRSLELNHDRFALEPQLVAILANTFPLLEVES